GQEVANRLRRLLPEAELVIEVFDVDDGDGKALLLAQRLQRLDAGNEVAMRDDDEVSATGCNSPTRRLIERQRIGRAYLRFGERQQDSLPVSSGHNVNGIASLLPRDRRLQLLSSAGVGDVEDANGAIAEAADGHLLLALRRQAQGVIVCREAVPVRDANIVNKADVAVAALRRQRHLIRA